MPKIKTNRGAAKRFKALKGGGFRRSQAYRNHILTKKRTKRKRHLRPLEMVDGADVKSVRRMLPNG